MEGQGRAYVKQQPSVEQSTSTVRQTTVIHQTKYLLQSAVVPDLFIT